MSPTCNTSLTLGSELTESINKPAESRRSWLYGQSPNTASVNCSAELELFDLASSEIAANGISARRKMRLGQQGSSWPTFRSWSVE